MSIVTAGILLAWLLMAGLGAYGFSRVRDLMAQGGRPLAPRPIVVIVAIKGVGPTTERFLDCLLAQDHPGARFVFAVESVKDPVHPLLLARQITAGRPIEIVVAGLSVDEGQKVTNLRAALSRVRTDDAVVVFLDADIVIPPDWLSHLDWAVVDAKQPIVTGYRLIVPTTPSLGGFFVASMDLCFLGSGRPTRAGLVWGGTTALAPPTIERLDLAGKVWRGALSDDVALGRAARAAGIPVMTERRLTAETPWLGSFTQATEFCVRQFYMVRRTRSGMFFVSLAVVGLPIVGSAAAALDMLAGGWLGAMTFALLVVLNEYRWRVRRAVVERVLGAERIKELKSWLLFDRLARPLYWFAIFAVMLIAAFKPSITWSGVTYALSGPNATRVLKRVSQASGRPSPG